MPAEMDPQARAFLNEQAEITSLPSAALSAEGAREALDAILITDEPTEEVAEVSDWSIPGPAGELCIRVYRPEGEGPFPVLVYFHGGGWVKGNLDSNDNLSRELTNESGMIVVAVDYRKPPEEPFPAALEDCYLATEWVSEYANYLDGDPSRIAVGGESAGGNLAAAVSLLARERNGPEIGHQLLLYPVLDRDFTRASYQEVGDKGLLTEESMRWYWNLYLESDIQAKNPYAAPCQARDLSDLPAATVVTAGWDPLHDEGVDYAERLEDAGNEVNLIDLPDQIHAFLSYPDKIDRALEVRAEIAEDLESTFGH